METPEGLLFRHRQDWRAWLEQNHDRAGEAWVFIFKKQSRQPGLTYDEAIEEALCYGWIDGRMKSRDADKFILRFSPRKPGSLWSKNNKDKADRLIAAGKMTAAGMERIEEARKNGLWEAAYSLKQKEDIPPDLADALQQNQQALVNFQRFANTYRNMYIAWVTRAGTPATRRKRIAEVVQRASEGKKPWVE